ncbi:MAG: phosphoribosyltransferase [Candidatus Thorarchaeota archaeon]|jgi:xanthine phosphoribosyltransferase
MPNNVRKDQKIDAVPWDDVVMGASMIADWIEEDVGDNVAIYGIPRGGMVVAIAVMHQFEAKGLRARFAVALDHLMPSELHKLVVIDEICDSGDTFRVIKQLYPMARTATLCHRDGAKFKADYYAYSVMDDRWLQFPWEVE